MSDTDRYRVWRPSAAQCRLLDRESPYVILSLLSRFELTTPHPIRKVWCIGMVSGRSGCSRLVVPRPSSWVDRGIGVLPYGTIRYHRARWSLLPSWLGRARGKTEIKILSLFFLFFSDRLDPRYLTFVSPAPSNDRYPRGLPYHHRLCFFLRFFLNFPFSIPSRFYFPHARAPIIQ